ncbi:hypothetical protein [Halostella pelagica]|uniref:hypothetical protein n=1 Tax=Halostella pelagica TaxID=2583824 RepID=UPI0010804B64|nr:hypothetical protein [Halostella pelagica]
MHPALRRLLIGPAENSFGRYLGLLAAGTLFVATFAAYAFGVFAVSGCVVFIPGDAAVVGSIAAAVVGYSRGGLVFAWLVAYAPLLGYHADHAFLGLSNRTVQYRLGYFIRVDGLAFLAVEGVVIGTVAFAVGYLGSLGVEFVRSGAEPERLR